MKTSFGDCVRSRTRHFDHLYSNGRGAEAEAIAFAACGCLLAWPAWWMRKGGSVMRIDCLHLECKIRRGEYKRPPNSVRTNSKLRDARRWYSHLRSGPRGTPARKAMAKLVRRCREVHEVNDLNFAFVVSLT